MCGFADVDWKELNDAIVSCERCPRLRGHCKKIALEKRRAYKDSEYWGKPVPNFGDPQAALLIVGLAPAAHGANRTGRMFTGDRSGDWLYRALHKAGFANQSTATNREDGLVLSNCAITAVCHCAPPQNKPSREEISNCRDWFDATLKTLPVKVFLALGQIGWRAVFGYFKKRGIWNAAYPAFGHSETIELENGQFVVGSYHPSQQNTFTKRLTESMFDEVFRICRKIVERKSSRRE